MMVALTVAVLAHLEPFPGEVAVVEWVNGWPRAIGALLEAVMVMGTLPVAIAVFAVVAVATVPTRPLVTVAVWVAMVSGYLVDDLIKGVVDRPRPSTVLTTLTVRDHPDGASFPSGHVTLAVTMALVVLPLLPARWRPVPLVLAAGVAIARLYVGVHWPTDLVGGAALGTILAFACWLVVRSEPAPERAGDAEYRPEHP